MHDKINKIIWIIFSFLFFFLICFISYDKLNNKVEKEYIKKIFYMDTYIYIKVYSNDSKLANKSLKEIEKIYKEYHELTDKYNSYENINNLYYITNNNSDDEYIKIDKKLYDMIDFGIKWYDKSNGLIDISLGGVTDIWKSYRENKNGVPSYNELSEKKNDINNIILKDGMIKNNHVNIDLGSISKGYTTKIVGEYLNNIGIKKYLINAGGNVLVGDNYSNKKYTIGIEDPNSTEKDIFTIVECNNKAVVTSGGYERFYEYDNKKYHHIIDPKTLFPGNNMKSVTVITDDSSLADVLSTMLFLMTVDDGLKLVNDMDNVEAIWYTNDDKEIVSNGYEKYKHE